MSLSLPTRRALLAALAAFGAPGLAAAAPAASLSPQDLALVQKAAAYLEGLTEAKGRFVQIDPRGLATQGDVYLKRPGKARFAYDPPAGLTVVSDGGRVSVLNSRLKTFESYPLMATPLSLFLAKHIRLDKGVTITRVARYSDGFSVTARDKSRQAEGQITLNFLDSPMALTGWTVTDAQGRTTVRLSGFQRASGLDPSLFVLKDPRPKNPGRAKM
jgi:outer membrane lipoprotein-sorting protein